MSKLMEIIEEWQLEMAKATTLIAAQCLNEDLEGMAKAAEKMTSSCKVFEDGLKKLISATIPREGRTELAIPGVEAQNPYPDCVSREGGSNP